MGWTPPQLYGIYVPRLEIWLKSQEEKEPVMKLSRVGVDLAKNVYQLHGVDRHGKTIWKRRLRR